ncbi:Uncharacterised protein [Mycobacteroides abscessus subsp. abscessus]|nr:Uncharacterised protein [Mycobacteroides abscessus subsp. abscessus]
MLCRKAEALRSLMASSSISATLATSSAMMSPKSVDRSKWVSVADTSVTLCSRDHLIRSARSKRRRTMRSTRKNTMTSNLDGSASHRPSWGLSKGVVLLALTSRSSATPTTSYPRVAHSSRQAVTWRSGLVVASVTRDRRTTMRTRGFISGCYT